MHEIITRKLMLQPVVGMTSLVGIFAKDYPLEFGNYCSISGGPYLCNMWAENLKEWASRNRDSGPIEVTEYTHGDRSIGMVTDTRMTGWCSRKPCVTGHGWPSVSVMRLICDKMGVEPAHVCGCESPEESPRLSESWNTAAPGKVAFTCVRCQRRWEVDKSTGLPT